MRTFRVDDEEGVRGEIRQLPDGTFTCPVCGWPWPYPVMTPIAEDVQPIKSLCQYVVGDICSCCKTEFGVDVLFRFSDFQRERTKWLRRTNWSHDALKQLDDNLGITEEQARAEAQE